MQHIFLIGLSGSGKSTVGRLLAQRLGRPLLDLDALIEEECGERIPAIFERHGEAYFRSFESRVLTKMIQNPSKAVIATGGGVVNRPENRALMAAHGVRVYLFVEPHQALQRLQNQHALAVAEGKTPEIRPLLSGPDPLASLQHLFLARHAWYQEAELSCLTQDKSPEQVAQEVLIMLMNRDETPAPPPIVRPIRVREEHEAVVEWGGVGRLEQYLKRLGLPPRVFLVTDSHLHDLYIPTLTQQLKGASFEPVVHVVPAGETSKSQQQLSALYDWLVDAHAERGEAILAFGGGVVGDLTGYLAATYLRGVPLIQIPTSLLAQVDSAIGGKTGINHSRGKNLIGAFYHPRLILADPSLLLTLPVRERTEGWAEVVKYGIILDAELFALLEAHAETLRDFSSPPVPLLCQIIARCIDLKASVIEGDEREQGRRAILNYGHTLGHALENVSGYGEWLHGEAVSLGMVAVASLAQKAGLFSTEDLQRQNQLLRALGLPTVYRGSVHAQDILEKIQLDKKVVGKRVRWVIARRIGEAIVTPLPDELVSQEVKTFFEEQTSSATA